jgi:protein-disulfide isomerase
MGDNMRFVFRNFPLTASHPHAEGAAEAAEAAGAQGKFWEMHDTLYENQDTLDRAHLHKFAGEIGLDMERFKQDLDSRKHEERVHKDFMGGVRSGVNGTPTFFINGARYNGRLNESRLMQALEEATQ